MTLKTTFKCLNCNEKHPCDPRNVGRQSYCPKPDCRRASKAESQRRWTGKEENANYFLGAENCERVRRWRKEHPGYWRKKKPGREDALQETLNLQEPEPKEVVKPVGQDALQDVCLAQPALLVGLISIMTGHLLQEDIAASVRSFLTRGEDILRMTPKGPTFPNYENQTDFVSRTAEASTTAI